MILALVDFKHVVKQIAAPIPYTLGVATLLALTLRFRKVATSPIVFGIASLIGLGLFVYAFPDPNFNQIVTKGDNVPIVGMLGGVIFFTWLSLRRAVINDDPPGKGEATLEAELSNQKGFGGPRPLSP